MLEVDKNKDMKKQFIDSSVRVISKGHNTDTNASIVLGMVGAIIGYNNIPSFFKNKIINSNSTHRKNRAKDFSSQKVIGIVEQLLSNGAK